MPTEFLQVSSFIHPSMVGAALVLGLIPVLVHLINRRRYVRLKWAAMTFLLAANRRSLKRIRLEQFLLLLARIGIVVLFGLALARPYLTGFSVVPLSSTRVHRVIVLDDSLSMNARAGEQASRFERAKRYAAQLIDAFPTADPVSIVTCSRPATVVIGEPAFDHRLVRQQFAAISQTRRSTDVVGALSLASGILEDSEFPPANRAVYLISDFPDRLWRSETRGNPTPAVGALRQLADRLSDSSDGVMFISVAADEVENVALTGMDVATSLVAVNRPVRITVGVTNFGRISRRGVMLQVLRGGNIFRREPLPDLGPGESTAATIAMVFTTPGTHLIEASITSANQDVLVDDNTRYLSIEVREQIPVLLVDGRPGITRLAGQAGYLATALAPKIGQSDSTAVEPIIVTEPDLAMEDLADYDVVVLCNVPQLGEEGWESTKTFVRSGGGLLIFTGDLVDVGEYNRFAHAQGTGLLPGRLSRARSTDTVEISDLGFDSTGLTHSCVREFADHRDSGLFSARVTAYLPIELDEKRSDLVMRYTNGDPAIVSSRFGEGRVMIVTTTANMDWTNLPAKGDYVSLMSNILAYLAPQRGAARNILVGQFVQERLTAVETSMTLRVGAGGGRTAEGDVQAQSSIERTVPRRATDPSSHHKSSIPVVVPDGDALSLVFGPIEDSGPVRVSIGSEVRIFAANVDPEESDLAAADAETLEGVTSPPIRVVSAPMSPTDSGRIMSAGSAEIAPTLLCLVIILLVVEMWMAMHFGSPRVHTDRFGK